MKLLVSIATAALIFPLTIRPDAHIKCADATWKFQTVSNTTEYVLAEEVAHSEYCRVVADNVAMWN